MNTVEMKQVSKKMDDFSINKLSFTVPKGYITGFIGPNGSGKTSTIRMMMDVWKADQGEIKVFGQDMDTKAKQRIGFVYDDLYMYENFTIDKMRSFIAPLYDTWDPTLFWKYQSKFGLPTTKKLKKFSKGMKMKCSLLFALSHNPEFIIMDEPTAGLDPVFRRELIDLLQELMTDENRTIFFSTHITTDLDQIADYIVFIKNGGIVFQKSMEEIKETFHIVKGKNEDLDPDIQKMFEGIRQTDQGFSGLFTGNLSLFDGFEDRVLIEKATLEDIMYFMLKR
ncbi:ABC transporter ATP-binding protein [Aquibacillus koreensis]|uniref:ABC transporter ATP-binding protein n=1 Tax=Aquibacillus koreensis TaxID=279446 RepID=A0A9X3WK06_9BACI|nr:ABC transporter ATP-binding protein [Aquibacillus koreensis]MCT2534668.1 ABC transporter ATP-binding protein [Aquibacillus koreensis]MDC3419721.1 ABC transporter ATP-binding protein [Aquibacillus koreensis]